MINVFNKSEVLKKYKVPTLKLLMTGGSKINHEIFEIFQNSLPNTLVFQGYGRYIYFFILEIKIDL